MSATNRDLERAVKEGRFREDLYYRLNIIPIALPPLKERTDDIHLLVKHFLEKYSEKNQKQVTRLSPDAQEQMLSYDWPGNVRELEHVIEKAVILARGPEISHIDLPVRRAAGPSYQAGKTLAEALRDCEYNTIVAALRAHDGVQARAADALGLSRSNLNYRLNKLSIKVREVMTSP